MKYVLMENLMGGYGVIRGEFNTFKEAQQEYETSNIQTLTIDMMTEQEIEKQIKEGLVSR